MGRRAGSARRLGKKAAATWERWWEGRRRQCSKGVLQTSGQAEVFLMPPLWGREREVDFLGERCWPGPLTRGAGAIRQRSVH